MDQNRWESFLGLFTISRSRIQTAPAPMPVRGPALSQKKEARYCGRGCVFFQATMRVVEKRARLDEEAAFPQPRAHLPAPLYGKPVGLSRGRARRLFQRLPQRLKFRQDEPLETVRTLVNAKADCVQRQVAPAKMGSPQTFSAVSTAFFLCHAALLSHG